MFFLHACGSIRADFPRPVCAVNWLCPSTMGKQNVWVFIRWKLSLVPSLLLFPKSLEQLLNLCQSLFPYSQNGILLLSGLSSLYGWCEIQIKPAKALLSFPVKGAKLESQVVLSSALVPACWEFCRQERSWLYPRSNWEREDTFGSYCAILLTWNLNTEWRPYINL